MVGEGTRCTGLVTLPVIALLMVFGLIGTALADVAEPVDRALGKPTKPHPRLFFPEGETERVRRNIENHPLLKRTWASIWDQADAMLEAEPVERRQVGRRLLGVSRTALKRVGYLALAYRLSGEAAYLERAEREMLAAAGFSDWNPSHFLDVAEMTAALAIGYDWLHDALSEESRQTIREAIVEKGLQTSFEHAGWWVSTTNNWSQVCHGGLTMGALAVMEHEPELAKRVLVRALENIHRPMDVYGPNGAYPEGPGYWSYGTSYNVLFIDALVSALGTDFGLMDHERFMASADYYLHVHGPTQKVFNYSDNRASASVSPEMYWFARELDRPSLLWMERRKLADFVESDPDPAGGGGRLFSLLPVWAPGFAAIDSPEELHYTDSGEAPIGIHRSDWDARATFIGIKGGTPRTNHGQMDTGSFVMDSDGIRWAVDLGVQSYHSLESAGIDLWNMAQNSERWSVFRLNNYSKNTLVVDDRLQQVGGFAPIVSFSGNGSMPHTVVDLSETYRGQLAKALRGVALRNDVAIVQDELTAPDREVEVRWGMVTRAEVDLVADDGAVLTQGDEALGLQVVGGSDIAWETYNTAEPPKDHDAANPGTRMIGFTVTLAPDEQRRFSVLLAPGGPREQIPEVGPLDAW